eukprot:TRINITY_DN5596_c2_g1_i1.p2 TRINITY_DN5596_c2_g1~~TRINITY_DN5596_c2_g1_i1.p2  ORF type:complete len:160 (-),score=31.38 TRINITY_DN5596_c2_g1_i1:299-706(-)
MADVVIDESHQYGAGPYSVSAFSERYGISDLDSSQFPFLANEQLYTLDKAVGKFNNSTDWFETAVVEAQETLIDFVSILQPEIAEQKGLREPRWLRNIGKNEDVVFISPEECVVDECAFQPEPLCPFTDIQCLTA